MAEEITVSGDSRGGKYCSLLPQVYALVGGEENRIANLANVVAALKSAFDFFWVGFYLVEGEQLVLGPFQGPVACTRIGYGRGGMRCCLEREKDPAGTRCGSVSGAYCLQFALTL